MAISKIPVALAAISLVAAPIAAQAATSERVSAPAVEGSELGGRGIGPALIVIALAAAGMLFLILSEDDDDDAVSA